MIPEMICTPQMEKIALSAGYLRICGYGLILLNLLFLCRSTVQGMGMPSHTEI